MADPGKLAAELLQKNFHLFGSFRKRCRYDSVDNSVYDSHNRTSTPVIKSSQEGVYIIFDDMSGTTAFDNVAILQTDKVAIFPSLDLNAVPNIGDIIEDEDGVTWTVQNMVQDPKPAHYSLHVRPS